MVKPCKKFFKVFLPDQSSEKMKLPPEFQKHFNGTVPFKSTIVNRAKRSWKVDLEKVGDDLYFNKGWEQFVRDHSLDFGDFLVFVYGSNAMFHVKIYGSHGCEKEFTYPTWEHSGEVPHSDKIQLVDKNDFECLEDEATEEDIEKDDKALKEASKFKSDFPFFKVYMHAGYIKRGSLNVPTSFIKRHMIDTEGAITATLVHLDKSWSAKMSIYTNHGRPECKFGAGTVKFVKDNAVKEGDVCLFELVNTIDHYVFKVSIFRCSD